MKYWHLITYIQTYVHTNIHIHLHIQTNTYKQVLLLIPGPVDIASYQYITLFLLNPHDISSPSLLSPLPSHTHTHTNTLSLPLHQDTYGAPVLPGDVTGSISHKDDLAVGVASVDSTGGIGVDIERCNNKVRRLRDERRTTVLLVWSPHELYITSNHTTSYHIF